MNRSKRLHEKGKILIAVVALLSLSIIPMVSGISSASTGSDSILVVNDASSQSQQAPSLLGLGAIESISQTSSGVVEQDSLTTGNTNYWTFNGDAIIENAPYIYSEDSAGLHIGVKAAVEGQFAGYYAVSPLTTGQLFHATISLPSATVPDGSFNVALYVQTFYNSSSPMINYIACGAGVDQGGYYWEVVATTGNATQATNFNILYFAWMGNQPLTQECQIITNGSNSLSVYLGGKLVFSSNGMNLNMPEPFNSYLEVETTSANQMLFGTFTNYYATTSGTVTVNNALPGSVVEIVTSSGNVLASTNVGLGTTASLSVGMYSMPLNAYIKEYDATGLVLVASTASPVTIWGGDVYTINL